MCDIRPLQCTSIGNKIINDQLSNYDVLFITNRLCPYAQKVWITLEMYSILYDTVEISLYGTNGKPNWFLRYNPKGTVPVLVLYNKLQQHSSSNTSTSSTSLEKKYSKRSHNVVLTDSDKILDYIHAACCCNSSDDDNNITHSERLSWWRQKIVNDQLLPIGKQFVLASNNKNKQLLFRIFQQIEDRLIEESVLVSNRANYDQTAVVYTMGGRYSDVNSTRCGNDRTHIQLLAQLATIADCHAFPFLYRIIQHQQLDYKMFQNQFPELDKWYQQWRCHPVFAKTITNSWWWWW